MRSAILLLLLALASCQDNSESRNDRKLLRDSIAAFSKTDAFKKINDSLEKYKDDEFKRRKAEIPFSQEYYVWFEITYTKDALNDPQTEEYHSVAITEAFYPDLVLANDCNNNAKGNYSIVKTRSGPEGLLFETISLENKEALLWKLEILEPDSSSGEWSYKRPSDKSFHSLSSFMPAKYVN